MRTDSPDQWSNTYPFMSNSFCCLSGPFHIKNGSGMERMNRAEGNIASEVVDIR